MEWYPYSRIGRINIAKMSTIKKKFLIKKKLNVRTTQSHLQNQYNTYENSNGITHINRKKILKFIWNLKEPQIPKTSLKNYNKFGDLILHDFKTY